MGVTLRGILEVLFTGESYLYWGILLKNFIQLSSPKENFYDMWKFCRIQDRNDLGFT